MHLLEGIRADFLFVIVQHEASVGQNRLDFRFKVAVGIAEAVAPAVAAVEATEVGTMDGAFAAVQQAAVEAVEVPGDVSHELFSVEDAARDLAQGHGIWRVAFKDHLVDVEADPRDGGVDLWADERMLQEHAADLRVEPIDVVGPFHANAAHNLLQRLCHSQSLHLRKQELAAGADSVGVKADAEKQAAILHAEAERQAAVLRAEGEAEAIMKVQTALADSIKLLNNANPNDQVVKLKALESFEKAADGQATKIIVPSEIQSLAGLAASFKGLLEDEKK